MGDYIDISGDGGVLKKTLAEGQGECPPNGAEISVHYTGWLTDGTTFDSSRDRDAPFTFTLGEGGVIKGWDIGVAKMKKGEKAMFTLKPEYAYGAAGAPPKIPANATLKFEIELLGFEVQPKNNKERIERATTLKDEGGVHFKQSNFVEARRCYHKAIDLIDIMFDETDEEKKAAQALLLPLSLNYAQCCIKEGMMSKALEMCDKALAIDINNPKAHYRKAMTYKHEGEYDLSISELEIAVKLLPQDTAILHELNEVKKLRFNEKVLEKQMYAKMFSSHQS